MDFISNLALGFSTAASPENLRAYGAALAQRDAGRWEASSAAFEALAADAMKKSADLPNVAALVEAVQAAHDREMSVLALTGHHGGGLARQLRETDVHVCVPHERAARIREVQYLVLHCLCDGIDTQLLGEEEPL